MPASRGPFRPQLLPDSLLTSGQAWCNSCCLTIAQATQHGTGLPTPRLLLQDPTLTTSEATTYQQYLISAGLIVCGITTGEFTHTQPSCRQLRP